MHFLEKDKKSKLSKILLKKEIKDYNASILIISMLQEAFPAIDEPDERAKTETAEKMRVMEEIKRERAKALQTIENVRIFAEDAGCAEKPLCKKFKSEYGKIVSRIRTECNEKIRKIIEKHRSKQVF